MNRYNPKIHHRRSIRLKGYDYSQAGLYFITICTKNREHIFGEIKKGKMVFNKYGEIVNDEWIKTPEIRPNVELNAFMIMPNHIHGIIVINESRGDDIDHGDDICRGRGVLQYAPTGKLQSPSQTIGAIIRGFKSAVTKQINISRNTPGIPVWQRNYYENIIRDDESYNRIAEYIQNNPINWKEDNYYSRGVSPYDPTEAMKNEK